MLEYVFNRLRDDDSLTVDVMLQEEPEEANQWREAIIEFNILATPSVREEFVKNLHEQWVIPWDSRSDNYAEIVRLTTRLLPGIDLSEFHKKVLDVKSKSRLWNYTGD
jgi:hypothetical protein